jgi:hypothetical protein
MDVGAVKAPAALGHTVRLMPPAYVKPYVKRQKNDAADAEAICEAVTRANMRFLGDQDARAAELPASASPHAPSVHPPGETGWLCSLHTTLAALKGGRQPGRLRKLRNPPSTFDDSWVREQHDAIHVPTMPTVD